MTLPKNKFLRGWISLIIFAVSSRLIFVLFANSRTWEGAINGFLTNFFMIYAGGAVWSGLPLVALPAMMAAVSLGITLCIPTPTSRIFAKLSFSILACLSLFAIWLEPWLTNAGIATNVVFALLKFSTFIVDIGFTAAWLIAGGMLFRCLETDFCQGQQPVQPALALPLAVVYPAPAAAKPSVLDAEILDDIVTAEAVEEAF